LRFTQELASEFGAPVLLVHNVPETKSIPARYFDGDWHQFLRNAAQQEIAKRQSEAGTSFPVRLTEKSLAQDIADVSMEQRADLIVIGRGVVQETFGTWRTHACEIVRQAPCPVLSYAMHQREPGRSRKEAPTLAKQPVGEHS